MNQSLALPNVSGGIFGGINDIHLVTNLMICVWISAIFTQWLVSLLLVLFVAGWLAATTIDADELGCGWRNWLYVSPEGELEA